MAANLFDPSQVMADDWQVFARGVGEGRPRMMTYS
jgi:hypothetical protein